MSQAFPPDFGPSDPRAGFEPPPPPGGRAPRGGGWLPPSDAPMRGGFAPPPKRRGGILRLLVAGVVAIVLLDLVLLNVGIIGAIKSSQSRPEPRQVTLAGDTTGSVIASVPVVGLITESSAVQFDECLTGVEKDKSVKALILDIDTPGGSATASDEMYHRVMKFKKQMEDENRSMPVVIAMAGMATSGGYYLACSGDYVFAQPQTMTANIGVLMPRFNLAELMNKYGVHEDTIVATGCDYKNAGSMFQPEDAKGHDYLQGLVDATFEQFKDVVKRGRGSKMTGNPSDIFNGRVYMAADALKLGLIDKIGYREDAYAYAKTQAGLSTMKIVSFEPTQSLFGSPLSDSVANITGASAKGGQTISFDGMKIDARSLMDLVSPKPMYLFGGF